jgi:predicted MPP superfamily phosphohydrolase
VHLLLGDHLDASQLVKRPMRPEAVAAELSRLRAPLGVISVIGNHDWHNAGERMWRALSRAGITVLEDRAIELVAPARAAGSAGPAAGGSFWVAGLGDLRHRRADLGAALAAVPPGAPVLLLSHDPDVFPRVPARVALTLAGHTHGGQVAVPVLRRPTLPSRFGERYARGHIVEGGRHLLVTSGVGTSGLPVRLFAPPEVLVVTLRAAG